MDPVIRRATVDDIAAVLELWKRAGAPPTHTDNVESLEGLLASDREALIVADADGVVVGSVIAGWDGWRGSIYRIAVAPEARRGGLGRRLLAAAEQRLTAAGATRLDAIVVETDEQAVEFWRSVGWEQQIERVRFVRG